MTWHIEAFDALTPRTLYAILQARAAVFVVEQDCPYLDPDGADLVSTHLWAQECGAIAAYCRIVPPGVKFADGSIGRIITTAPFRGTGLGRALVRRAIDHAVYTMGYPTLRLSAQARLRRFYEAQGFVAVPKEPYLEDNIPHIEMLLRQQAP